MLFFVKVRIDVKKLEELGQKLQSGELDTSQLKSTYCLKEDPSVGLNIWEAEDRKTFEQVFAPHKAYYAEVMEVVPVILPQEAQILLMKQLT
jgi:hypothetical protein